MLQRLNTWGRRSIIACVGVTITAASLIGSPEVPGGVMQFDAFALPGVSQPADVCDILRGKRDIVLWFCGEKP